MGRMNQESAPAARDARLTVRFSSEEMNRVRRAARARGLPVSGYVRGAACEVADTTTSRESTTGTGLVKPALSPEQVAVIDAARVDHKRLSVNLNQFMRLAHRGQVDLGKLAPVVVELNLRTEWLVDVLSGRRSL